MTHDFKKFPELTNSQMVLYYWDSPHKQILENFIAEVIKVSDGDSIRVKWEERDFDFPVRLAFIDAPELDDEGGEASKSWLEDKILGEEVEIFINPKNRVGKFGRIIGEVMHLGVSVCQESLNLNYSIPFGSEVLI